jgi:transcription elongation factor
MLLTPIKLHVEQLKSLKGGIPCVRTARSACKLNLLLSHAAAENSQKTSPAKSPTVRKISATAAKFVSSVSMAAGADLAQRIWGAGLMASAEREPITGVWGLCPQWGPGAKPLVGGQWASPLKPTRFLV